MTIEKVTFKAQVAKHIKIAAAYTKVATDVHLAACEDLLHASIHGDVSLCRDLYDKLGGAVSPARTATLKQWFMSMSGGQMTAEKDTWKLKKGWKPELFLLDQAEASPYWTMGGEVAPKEMSIEAFLKTLAGYAKKIDKAVEEERFTGDPEAAKKLVSQVIDFASARAKLLPAGKTVVEAIAVTPADAKGASRAKVRKAKGQVTADGEQVAA